MTDQQTGFQQTWEVESRSTPGLWYKIEERTDTVHGGVYLYCDCPAWKFARGKGNNCKHIEQVLRSMGEKQREPYVGPPPQAAEATGSTPVPAEAKLVTEKNCRDGVCHGVRGTPRETHSVADHEAMVEMGLW